MTDQPDLPLNDEFDPDRLPQGSFDDVPMKKWARSLIEGVEAQVAAFQRMGYSQEEAHRLAQTAMVVLSQLWGGRSQYLPFGESLTIALRDSEIFHRATRDNLLALADEYKMTERHVRRIVFTQARLHRRRMQGSLFPTGE